MDLTGVLDSYRRILSSLIREALLFSAAVELAESHPKAVGAVAEACRGLVRESLEELQNIEADEYVEKACEKLRLSLSILDFLAGDTVLRGLEEKLPPYTFNKPLLLLDMAHSYVHEAIDFLNRSERFRAQQRLLELLSEARRRSAPKHVYLTIYRLVRESRAYPDAVS